MGSVGDIAWRRKMELQSVKAYSRRQEIFSLMFYTMNNYRRHELC